MHMESVLLGTRPPETAEVGGRKEFSSVDLHTPAAWRPLLRFGTCGVSGAGVGEQNDRCPGPTCRVKTTLQASSHVLHSALLRGPRASSNREGHRCQGAIW